MATSFCFAARIDYCWIVLGLVVAAAESVGDPVATILVGKIFKDLQLLIRDQAYTHEFLSNVRVYSLCLVGVAGYTLLMNWMGFIVWTTIGYRQGHFARLRLYRGMMMRSAAWYDGRKQLAGTTLNYFKDIQDIEAAAGLTTYEIVSMAVGFCLQVGVAFYFSWAVTLVCFAGIPVLIIIGFVLSPRITQKVLASKAVLDSASARVSWALKALETVKVFQRECHEWMSAHRLFDDYRRSSISYWLTFKLQEGLCRAIVLIIFVQGFYFGSYMVSHHGLDAGKVITVFLSCLTASGLLQQLVEHLVEWNKGNASAVRLFEAFGIDETAALFNSIGLMPGAEGRALDTLEKLGWNLKDSKTPVNRSLDTSSMRLNSLDSGLTLRTLPSADYTLESCDSDYKENSKGHVTFSDVVFSYPSRDEIVLAGLSLEFKPGALTFVLGSSGSGKSTIAALLSQQYPWQAGEIAIDGHGVDLLSRNWIERNVYVVEQMPKLFDISIMDNIKIGSRFPEAVTEQQLERACAIACLDFLDDLPNKMQTTGGYPLSGGQIQRISLARAIINDAPILILDEATSALDPRLQVEVMQNIYACRSDKTTVVITHDPSIIPQNCPMYVVNDGIAQLYTSASAANSLFDIQSSPAGLSPTEQRSLQQDHQGSKPVTHPDSIKLGNAWSTSRILLSSLPSMSLFATGLVITAIHAAINPVFSFVCSKLILGVVDLKNAKTTLWAMLVLMCAILDGLASFLSVTLNICGEQWLQTIRERLFSQLLSSEGLLGPSVDRSYYSKLLMSDTEKCADILTLYWPGVLNMTVLGLMGFTWSMVTGWKLTLVGISLLPAFAIANQWYKWLVTRWTSKRESRRADVIRLMSDLMTPEGFHTVKVQHLEKFFEGFYNKRESALHALSPRIAIEVGSAYGTLKCFPYTLEALLLWYGMYLTAHGQYSAQATMTVFSLIMFTVVTIDQLTSVIGRVGTGFEALQRLIYALETTARSPSQKKPRHSALLFDGRKPIWSKVSFHKVALGSPGRPILSTFNASFSEGETVAIVGPSGAGKSTIAKLLLKLARPTSGEIVIDDGWDLDSVSELEVRQNVTMVGQMPLDFFDGTIEDNLLYALNPNDPTAYAKAMEACKLCGVDAFVSTLKDGYKTHMTNGTLSGGQMQRLGIARALSRSPRVLILDESTSALDQESKHLIIDLIINLKSHRDITIIIITHQMDVASIADRRIQLLKS